MELPKNLNVSLPTRRFIAFAIDFAVSVLVGFLLFAFWGTKGLFDRLGGNALWNQAMEFYGTSHLYEISKNEDGTWGTDYKLIAFDVTPSSSQEKPGYELYLDHAYLFYTDFLPNNGHIDDVTTKAGATYTASEYYTGKHFNTAIIGLPADLSTIDIANEATYTSENGYFKYALNEAGTEIDPNAKPVLSQATQELVDAGDTTTLSRLQALFYSGNSAANTTGIIYDAAVLLSQQSYLQPIGDAYLRVNWAVNATVVTIPAGVFFLLIPLFSPNGESLGKWIMRMGVAKRNGCKIGLKERLLRPFVVLAILCVFALIPRSYTMFALMGVMVLLFADFMFVLMDKSGAYRALQDRLAGTLVYDKKKSTLFKTLEEVEEFKANSETIVTPNRQAIKAVDSEAILLEQSIIDGDSFAKEASDIVDYDELEGK